VNLSGGVVQQQYDTSRAVNFQGLSGTAGGHFSGQLYVARAEAGYPLALGGLTLTPLASLPTATRTRAAIRRAAATARRCRSALRMRTR